MFSKLAPAFLAIPLLAACETIHPETQSKDPGFGESMKYNAAVQTVNPEPEYAAGDALPGESGERAAKATQRYRTGQVNETEGGGTGSGTGGGTGPR